MSVVSTEQAQKEVTGWLDKKKVFAKERDKKAEEIEILVDAVVNGVITIDDSGIIKHTFIFPIEDKEGKVALSEMSYKLRLDTASINQRMQGVKMDMSMISAYVSALTDQSRGIVEKLDTQDAKIARTIATFFM